MASSAITRFLNPWKHRREQLALKVEELRQRDGDYCRRCRRPIRFDLPAGHDLGARIEQLEQSGIGKEPANLCLTHVRCVSSGQDHTAEVAERLRPQREAELFATARERRAA